MDAGVTASTSSMAAGMIQNGQEVGARAAPAKAKAIHGAKFGKGSAAPRFSLTTRHASAKVKSASGAQ